MPLAVACEPPSIQNMLHCPCVISSDTLHTGMLAGTDYPTTHDALYDLATHFSQTPLSAKKLKDRSPCHRDQMVEDILTIEPMPENLNILRCLEVWLIFHFMPALFEAIANAFVKPLSFEKDL